LLIRKWAYFRPHQSQHAYCDTFAQHWDGDGGAVVSQSLRFNHSVFRISFYVGDVNGPAFEQGPTAC
jgi:hypothetical protein